MSYADTPEICRQIVGEQLSGVVFVMDYIQLQFNPPLILDVLTPISVMLKDSKVVSGDDQFRNKLCEQITKIVAHVSATEDEFCITFEDNSRVSVSLRFEDCVGPESMVFYGRNGEFIVFRPGE